MKLFSTLTMLLLPLFGFSQYSFKINAKVPAEFNGHHIHLDILDNDIRVRKPLYTDSAKISNGYFTFKGNISQPCTKASFSIHLDKMYYVGFVIDTGSNAISVQFDMQFAKQIKIFAPGSISNTIKNKVDSLFTDYYRDYRKEKNIQGTAVLPIDKQYLLDSAHIVVLKQYPNCYYSLIDLYNLSLYFNMANRPKLVLNTLSAFNDSLRNSVLGKKLYQKELISLSGQKASQTGQHVPEFTIKTFENKEFDNASLAGTPYIIAFSATWCIPCQEQLPVLKSIYEKYKSKGLKVVYFNNDDNIELWKQHITKDQLTWINVSERLKHTSVIADKQFGVYAIPTYILVDQNGTIIFNSDKVDNDINNLETYVKKLLN